MMDEKPRRRIVMLAKIQADSWDDLYGHLRNLTTQMCLSDKRLPRTSVSGGYSSGHIIVTDEDGSIDHNRWAADLDAYLEDLRAKEETAESGQ
ncbi:MAG TPA: hypothetical protein VM265_08030 [Sphingomicrobium sp.]|nr:hypothetical protein [Sphingomicrobium sp.]